MTELTIREITKSFETTQALNTVSFSIHEGEIVALLGPSGCGKSTLLSIIAGLVMPDGGDVLWDGTSLRNTPAHLRGFGLMFQDFALFPHMNVYANVAFGLKMARINPGQIEQRVGEILSLVGLPDFSSRDVNSLSGGEQQRVALARALAPHPRLLMLDEPLGSLDRNLRERLVIDLRHILRQMNQTAIYVTHDQEEAFTIADRVILMSPGKIEQIGTPQEIFCDPATQFVARFLEMSNFVPGEIQSIQGSLQVVTELGHFSIDTPLRGRVDLLIRPDAARPSIPGPDVVRGVITEISFRGTNQKVTLAVNRIHLVFTFPSMVTLPGEGSEMAVSIDTSNGLKVFTTERSQQVV